MILKINSRNDSSNKYFLKTQVNIKIIVKKEKYNLAIFVERLKYITLYKILDTEGTEMKWRIKKANGKYRLQVGLFVL
ncbi:MAG: hypothetical protein KKE35_07455 [Actinobacteria bacterium]|nr:hypothetical protein [Actinomycetota bacterium]